MSYVPPALRRKQQDASRGEKHIEEASTAHVAENASHLHSLKDIQKHFWPNWVAEAPVSASTPRDDHYAAESVPSTPELHNQQLNETHTEEKNGPAATETSTVSAYEVSSIHPAATPSNADRTTSHDGAAEKINDTGSGSNRTTHQASLPVPSAGELHVSTISVSKDENQPIGMEEIRRARRNTASDPESAHPHNTLNSTEETQDSLQYVLLFHDANPRWLTDGIIYVKSALDLLPALHQDKEKEKVEETPARRIMIFEQQNNHKTISNAMFKFTGYFNLTRTQILEPQTPELVRMQEQKWTRTDKYGRSRPINRNAESWRKSLTQRWAVLKFEKDDEATKGMDPPHIESSSVRSDTNGSSGQERKSVNEMLRELRMRDGA